MGVFAFLKHYRLGSRQLPSVFVCITLVMCVDWTSHVSLAHLELLLALLVGDMKMLVLIVNLEPLFSSQQYCCHRKKNPESPEFVAQATAFLDSLDWRIVWLKRILSTQKEIPTSGKSLVMCVIEIP